MAVEVLRMILKDEYCIKDDGNTLVMRTHSVVFLASSYYANSWVKILLQHIRKSLVMTKPVFGVCDQVRHKPACAAIEARKRLKNSDMETRSIILSRQRTTKALVRLRGCAGWSAPLLFAYSINRFSHDVELLKYCKNKKWQIHKNIGKHFKNIKEIDRIKFIGLHVIACLSFHFMILATDAYSVL